MTFRTNSIYHDFYDYLLGLLSWSDLEEWMNKACDDLIQSKDNTPPTMSTDVWEASFLQDFRWLESDLEALFVWQREGQYPFHMFVNGFNVEGMHKCGRNASCTIITLACLALPKDIHYKPEYMYILIVPGPDHMTSTQIQYFLCPLISQMANSWKYGIQDRKSTV